MQVYSYRAGGPNASQPIRVRVYRASHPKRSTGDHVLQVQYSGKSARGSSRRMTTEVRQPLTECSWGHWLLGEEGRGTTHNLNGGVCFSSLLHHPHVQVACR